MAAISYHDTVNVLQPLCQPAHSPFERPEWFALLAKGNPQAQFMLASEGDLSAALALTKTNGRIEPLRNWFSFTWRPLVPHGAEGDRLLEQMACALRDSAPRVTLWPIPDEDGSASRLARAFRAAGWSVSLERCDTNHVLPVNGRSFEQYWAERPGRMRTTLKRKAKHVKTKIFTEFDKDAWVSYESIYAESWKPEEEDRALLRDFARQEGEAGRLRLGVATHEGLAVAAQFWTVEAGTAFIHKLAHLENHRNLSAGTVLSAALFAHVIDRDHVDLIDFGTGDDRYKRDWMEQVRVRYRLDCLDPMQARAWPALAKRAFRRLARGQSQG